MPGSFFPYIGAFMWIGFLLLVATFLRAKVKFLQTNLVPSALLAGMIGFILMTLGVVGIPSVRGWMEIPTKAFTMFTFHLFAFSFIGIGLLKDNVNTSNKTLTKGALWIALLTPFFYVTQGLIGKGSFELWGMISGTEVQSVSGYLIGTGFTGGPGQAFAFGDMWETTYQIAYAGSIGLAFAAAGFLMAVVVGVPLAKIGIKRGWVTEKSTGSLPTSFLRGMMDKGTNPPCMKSTTHPANIDNLAFHLAIMAVVYAVAYCFAVAWFLYMPKAVAHLGFGLIFLWAMCFAMIGRTIADKIGVSYVIDPDTVRRVTGTALDFMLCSVFMGISVAAIKTVFMPFLIATLIATIFTLTVVLWLGRRVEGQWSFERTLVAFGWVTGTAPSGLLLLRIIDPDFQSPIAIEVGIAGLFLTPFLMPLTIAYPLLPAGESSILWIAAAYIIIVPIVMYSMGLIKKRSW